jgi:Apea-like HEPN
MEDRPSLALLLHVVMWDCKTPEFQIAPNVTLCRFAGSHIERLYLRLCQEEGIDDGEPLVYGTYVLLRPTRDEEYLLDAGDPYSLADRVANLIVVACSEAISWSRVIWSSDDFQTADGTLEIHGGGTQTDFLQPNSIVIDQDTAGAVQHMWGTIEPMWAAEKSAGRLTSALVYFYYAWRAHYVEQMCLNLAVTLEVLFAPHSQSEATHQLCFNLCRFAGATPADREDLYKRAKKFYGVRSAIVHGGLPSDEDIIPVTTDVFHLTASLLRRILTDAKTAATFNSQTERRQLWNQFLFS